MAFRIIQTNIPSHLTMVGPDYNNGFGQKLVDELDLSALVTFTGQIPYAEVPTYLQRADIMLHSSLHEGGPGVAFEAMMNGVVVCSTRVGILSDLDDQCCRTVDIGDYKNLAAEALDLIEHKDQYFALRKAAYKWSLAHTINHCVENIGRIYKRIL